MLRKYIGDRKFYKMVMTVAVPIMIQNFITNFVSMLDNIMVGQVGTAQMSGVSIVNQILFVLNLCIFGATSGAGIFTAQFVGSGDREGVRNTFRFKLIACAILTVLATGIFISFGRSLISFYLKGEGASAQESGQYLAYGWDYLLVMLWGLPPFALSNVYSSTLREHGETVVPMVSGISAVLVNLTFNYILIFGHFGAPAMGVVGAAIATVMSRYVELAVVALWTHTHTEKMPFARGLYRTLKVPAALTRQIIRKGMPILVNEALWSTGMALLTQCYSVRGLAVVAAVNISSTINNTVSVAYRSMGNAVGIIIGQKLGAGERREAVVDTDRKLIAFSIFLALIFAIMMMTMSPVFPKIYNTTDDVRALASDFMRVMAVVMPFAAFTNSAYFTLRSGGKTMITLLFDCCFIWVIVVPLAFCLSRFTSMPIVPLYFCCQITEVIKCALGGYFLKKGTWIQSIVKDYSA